MLEETDSFQSTPHKPVNKLQLGIVLFLLIILPLTYIAASTINSYRSRAEYIASPPYPQIPTPTPFQNFAINIVAPAAGENLIPGKPYIVRWNYQPPTSLATPSATMITYGQTAQSVQYPINSGPDAISRLGSNSYLWSVPTDIPAGVYHIYVKILTAISLPDGTQKQPQAVSPDFYIVTPSSIPPIKITPIPTKILPPRPSLVLPSPTGILTPTPSPIITCSYVKSVQAILSCGTNSFRIMAYTCANGSSGVVGNFARCTTRADLEQQVNNKCGAPSSCTTLALPTPTVPKPRLPVSPR